MEVAVQAEGLVKHYGDVEAVRGVDCASRGRGRHQDVASGLGTQVEHQVVLLSTAAAHPPGPELPAQPGEAGKGWQELRDGHCGHRAAPSR